MAEIEKAKRRREERAIEKAQQRARVEFEDWEKKEKEFDFHQIKVKSEIRVREGRTKPIDVLMKHINGIEINEEPHMKIFKGMSLKDMEELHEDIKLHLEFDLATPIHIQYWEALLLICDWELLEARKNDALDRARVRGEPLPLELLAEDKGMHSSIEADVKSLLHGKSYAELEALESQIESQMRSGAAKVVEYWEALLKRLHILKVKACLKEIHAKMSRKQLEEETQDEASFLPKLLHVDPEEDKAILERKRLAVVEERHIQVIMGESDAAFGLNDEINLDSQVYWWHDKYRPRKPKYSNRVHFGYDWNRYNRTHYDSDNPVPKLVQGYKFNIFYPDLVDEGIAPSYSVEEDKGETCIIRFHAGPPYEDIAFRIVNKEWEYSCKKGFKSTFERGILHSYFNFKRYSYRR